MPPQTKQLLICYSRASEWGRRRRPERSLLLFWNSKISWRDLKQKAIWLLELRVLRSHGHRFHFSSTSIGTFWNYIFPLYSSSQVINPLKFSFFIFRSFLSLSRSPNSYFWLLKSQVLFFTANQNQSRERRDWSRSRETQIVNQNQTS